MTVLLYLDICGRKGIKQAGPNGVRLGAKGKKLPQVRTFPVRNVEKNLLSYPGLLPMYSRKCTGFGARANRFCPLLNAWFDTKTQKANDRRN
jgi:hypothetical protein